MTIYTVNYQIDYTNQKEKPNRGCHKTSFEVFLFILFFCQEWKVRYCTEKCIYT